MGYEMKRKLEWNRIRNAGKIEYIMRTVIYYVILRIGIFSIGEILQIIFGVTEIKITRLLTDGVFLIFVFVILGILYSLLEWSLYENILCGKWNKNIKKIKQRYIIIYGELYYGIPLALLEIFWGGYFAIDVYIIVFITVIIIGVCVGWIIWDKIEQEFLHEWIYE